MFHDQLFIAVKDPCAYFLYWMISSKQQPIYVTLFNWSLYKDEAMEDYLRCHGLAYICRIYHRIYHCITGVEHTIDRSL